MFGNLQKKVRFGLDEWRIYAKANNIANDLNSINAGKGYSRLSYIKALSWSVFIIAFAGFLSVIMPGVALGDGGTIPATVEIRALITLTRIADLNFGQVRSGETDGTVTVTPLNVRTFTGDVTLRAMTNFSRAEFIITGDPNATFTISPVLDFALHDKRGDPIFGETVLQVTNLLSYSTTVGAVTTVGQFNSNGIDSVFVGGTLLVPPGAKLGKYGGEVTLTFNY